MFVVIPITVNRTTLKFVGRRIQGATDRISVDSIWASRPDGLLRAPPVFVDHWKKAREDWQVDT